MPDRKVIYFCRDVSLSAVPGGYVVGVEGRQERFFDNVLEAWTNFIDTLDAAGRRRIAAMIKREKEQKNGN